MTNPISVPVGGKDGAPRPVTVSVKQPDLMACQDGRFPITFAEWKLPEIKGVTFEDFSAELDESLAGKKVREIGISADLANLGDLRGTSVSGKSLREIIQKRAHLPLTGPLVLAYEVSSGEGRDKREKTYWINGQIIATPEEAEEERVPRLAYIMRMKSFEDRPGIYVPLVPSYSRGQQITFLSSITRVVAVSFFGRKIGPAIGLNPSVRSPH